MGADEVAWAGHILACHGHVADRMGESFRVEGMSSPSYPKA